MTRTNVFTLLTVFVRLIALVFVLRALLQGVTVIALAFKQSPHQDLWFMLSGLLASIGLFGAVWLFADVLVRLALGRPQGASFESDLGADAWRAIGTSVVGVWFAANGALDLLHSGLRWFYTRRLSDGFAEPEWGEALFADVWASAAEVAVGVALLLGARGFVGVVRRMRGHEPAQDVSRPS